MTTADRRRVALDVAQQGAARIGEFAVAIQHHAPLQKISAGVNEHTLSRQPVTPRTARLLLVVLQRLRRAGMNDESDIGAVDAHPECDRCNHDVGIFVQECILMPVTIVVVEASVIRDRPDAALRQPRRERVDLAS